MRSFPKQLAASAVLLGLLAAGAALPATAASPLSAAAAITMPWATVAVESIAPGDYAATMTVGTAQQLSPDILPEKAAKRANVSFVSDNPNIVSVTSDGVAQAVGLGQGLLHVVQQIGQAVQIGLGFLVLPVRFHEGEQVFLLFVQAGSQVRVVIRLRLGELDLFQAQAGLGELRPHYSASAAVSSAFSAASCSAASSASRRW